MELGARDTSQGNRQMIETPKKTPTRNTAAVTCSVCHHASIHWASGLKARASGPCSGGTWAANQAAGARAKATSNATDDCAGPGAMAGAAEKLVAVVPFIQSPAPQIQEFLGFIGIY